VTLELSLSATRRALPAPAENAQQRWLERAGSIITLKSGPSFGQGEISPLPGVNRETLPACQQAFSSFDLRAIPSALTDLHDFEAELRRASSAIPRELPAARAGFEAALVDLWSRAAGVPAWALLSKTQTPSPRALSALLMGEPEQALAQAQAAAARGLHCFKFKIGRPHAFERELTALTRLRGEFAPGVRLRLDANRSLPRAHLAERVQALLAVGIELFEEPCAPSDLPLLADVALPLALDESLTELTPAKLSGVATAPRGVRALVLKPSLVGGISACLDWAAAAESLGLEVILSHAFEGPLGLALSAALAIGLGSAPLAHGLDLDGARLANDALPYFVGGQLLPWSEPGWGKLGVAP